MFVLQIGFEPARASLECNTKGWWMAGVHGLHTISYPLRFATDWKIKTNWVHRCIRPHSFVRSCCRRDWWPAATQHRSSWLFRSVQRTCRPWRVSGQWTMTYELCTDHTSINIRKRRAPAECRLPAAAAYDDCDVWKRRQRTDTGLHWTDE